MGVTDRCSVVGRHGHDPSFDVALPRRHAEHDLVAAAEVQQETAGRVAGRDGLGSAHARG